MNPSTIPSAVTSSPSASSGSSSSSSSPPYRCHLVIVKSVEGADCGAQSARKYGIAKAAYKNLKSGKHRFTYKDNEFTVKVKSFDFSTHEDFQRTIEITERMRKAIPKHGKINTDSILLTDMDLKQEAESTSMSDDDEDDDEDEEEEDENSAMEDGLGSESDSDWVEGDTDPEDDEEEEGEEDEEEEEEHVK